MLLNIATPGNLLSADTCIKVKAELTTGFLEIYKNHSPMAGRINIGSLEISFLDQNNKSYEKYYMAQDGIFTVSNDDAGGTCIYIYAQKLLEVDESLEQKKLEEELQNKQNQLKKEFNLVPNENKFISVDDFENNCAEDINNPKARLLLKEILFLDKSFNYVSGLRKNLKIK